MHVGQSRMKVGLSFQLIFRIWAQWWVLFLSPSRQLGVHRCRDSDGQLLAELPPARVVLLCPPVAPTPEGP